MVLYIVPQLASSLSGVMGISAGGVPLSVMTPTMSADRAAGVTASAASKRKIAGSFVLFIVSIFKKRVDFIILPNLGQACVKIFTGPHRHPSLFDGS